MEIDHEARYELLKFQQMFVFAGCVHPTTFTVYLNAFEEFRGISFPPCIRMVRVAVLPTLGLVQNSGPGLVSDSR